MHSSTVTVQIRLGGIHVFGIITCWTRKQTSLGQKRGGQVRDRKSRVISMGLDVLLPCRIGAGSSGIGAFPSTTGTGTLRDIMVSRHDGIRKQIRG